MSPWLSRLAVAEQETPRALLTPGEVLQLPANNSLVLVSGTPPIRAKNSRYFEDENFTSRQLPPPASCIPKQRMAPGIAASSDWAGMQRQSDARLEQLWSDLVSGGGRESPSVCRSRTSRIPRSTSPSLATISPCCARTTTSRSRSGPSPARPQTLVPTNSPCHRGPDDEATRRTACI